MRNKKRLISILSAFALVLAVGCGSDGSDEEDGAVDNGPPPEFDATGQVIDFETGDALTVSATVQVEGVVPAPRVSNQGSQFNIEGIPPEAAVFLLSIAPPDYVNTYNKVIEIKDADQTDLNAEAVKQSYLDNLATTFQVTLDPAKTTFIGRTIDEAGSPLAGIEDSAFALPENSPDAEGPFFLDANRLPDAALTATSDSGFFVFFNLAPDPIAVEGVQDGEKVLSMAVSPAAGGTVTLADVLVRDADQVVLPVDVSFANDVYPIFARRACSACHDKNAEGAAIGGLDLAHQKISKVYDEIRTEPAVSGPALRIDLANPEQSLLLIKPGPPAGNHPNLTFLSDADPDLQTILVWITEGAKNN